MVLHPVAGPLEDAGWDVLLQEAHASCVAGLVADGSAEKGAEGGRANEKEEIGVLCGEHDDHEVGEAGDGQRDEGGVDDGDKQDPDEAEGEQEVEERIGMIMVGGRQRGGEVLGEVPGGEDRGCGKRHGGMTRILGGKSRWGWNCLEEGVQQTTAGPSTAFGASVRQTTFRMTSKLEQAEGGKRGKDGDFGGVAAEECDGIDAGGRERVVDVLGEVVADGGGWDGDAWGPLFDELIDVGEAVVAGELKVGGELGWGDAESRDSGRTAQTAATQGRWVRVVH